MDIRTLCQFDGPLSLIRENSGIVGQKATKRSKSRNGCGTCKKKRLKCDEGRPYCKNCASRDVICDGYKHVLRWRIVDDEKAKKGRRAKTKSISESTAVSGPSASTNVTPEQLLSSSLDTGSQWLERHPPEGNAMSGIPAPKSQFSYADFANNDLVLPELPYSPSPEMLECLLRTTTGDGYEPLAITSGEATETAIFMVHDLSPDDPSAGTRSIVSDSTSTPDNCDIISRNTSQEFGELSAGHQSDVRSPPFIISRSMSDLESMDSLMVRFERTTSFMMSVEDGTSNPWQTMILPLARGSPALAHALAAMAAFHGAFEEPALHTTGMAHMTESVRLLGAEIQQLHLETALATSLALALSEGWDSHISTGIHHLHAAKVMLYNLVTEHRRDARASPLLQFLGNTFVYMDVIARLVQLETSEIDHKKLLAAVNSEEDMTKVDSLMGAAKTLFPMLGRVGNLVQQVRKSKENSLTVISSATEIQEALEHWRTPVVKSQPHDKQGNKLSHFLLTAEAYRYAALLYLHRAVPELPSASAYELAKKTLVLLASVSPSSRATSLHIFPLLVAGCEMEGAEDRDWVMKKWTALIDNVKIGSLKSCWAIVQEVWKRRDAYDNKEVMKQGEDALFQVDSDFTVRGRLHWLGVMTEWSWEVFL